MLSFLILISSICMSCEKISKVDFQDNNNSSGRTIQFSGIRWQVRNGTGNPGGNYWSDSNESVWVDEQGVLHLTIRKIDGEWFCTEISTLESFGYGEYKFYISSDVENLNENVVVGLFSYLNDKNEIDIEFSKWGNPEETKMGYYVVQPAKNSGNIHRFDLNLNSDFSTHEFCWEKERINFESWQGHEPVSTENNLIEEWEYKGDDIPVEGKEKLILNLWLYKGIIPSDGKEIEVLFKAVEFNK